MFVELMKCYVLYIYIYSTAALFLLFCLSTTDNFPVGRTILKMSNQCKGKQWEK